MPVPVFTAYPSTLSPTTFAADMDTMISEYPAYIAALNALGTDVAADAATALAAAGSALAAGAVAWVSGTTYAVGDARYSLVNQITYRRKVAGAGTADPSLDPTNWGPVVGVITVNGLTGALTVQDTLVSGTNIKTINGASLLGGGDISVGSAINTATLTTTGYALVAGDNAKQIVFSGTAVANASLPLAATAGAGWFVILRNERTREAGTGDITINVTSLINTRTSMSLPAGCSYMVFCNGTTYSAIKISGNAVLMLNSGTSWTCPAEIQNAKITCVGGGGGGGGGHATASKGSGGGSGGAGTAFTDLVPGTAYTIAIGAAGTNGAAGASGTGGGTTTFTGSGMTSAVSGTGGGAGAVGSATATAVTAGGGYGSGSSSSNDAGFVMTGQPGGFSLGATTGTNVGAGGWFIKGNSVGRGGSGGEIAGAGSLSTAGAIIIEY